MTGIELIVEAAKNIDWGQVVANGGPPCFHFEKDRGRFCLRAQRWDGHTDSTEWPEHPYVSLAGLIDRLQRAAPQEKPE